MTKPDHLLDRFVTWRAFFTSLVAAAGLMAGLVAFMHRGIERQIDAVDAKIDMLMQAALD